MNTTDGIRTWVGSVVNVNDPLKANRVQVRIFGLHDTSTTNLKNDDLLWALVEMPTTSAGVTGIGLTVHGLVPGSIVTLEFLDGINEQIPLVRGVILGISTTNGINAPFGDPSGKYPLKDRLNEPDVNRLGRNEKASSTYRANKGSSGSVSSGSVSWSQPADPYNAVYPNNKVIETTSGHVIEVDDTPGAERLHIRHKSGTYTEYHPNGDIVHYTVGSEYSTSGPLNVFVKGNANLTVNGNANTKINGNENRTISGDLTETISGNFTQNVTGSIKQSAGSSASLVAGSSITQNAGSSASLVASGSVTINGSTVNIN
jgi:hypothetical protein